MGLDCEADSHAQNTGLHKPLSEEAPDSYYAQADGDPCRIPTGKDNLTVGQHDANQKECDARRIVLANIPH